MLNQKSRPSCTSVLQSTSSSYKYTSWRTLLNLIYTKQSSDHSFSKRPLDLSDAVNSLTYFCVVFLAIDFASPVVLHAIIHLHGFSSVVCWLFKGSDHNFSSSCSQSLPQGLAHGVSTMFIKLELIKIN